MQVVSTVHFPDKLRLRVPRGLSVAIKRAAWQRRTTAAEWTRQALLHALEAQGIALPDAERLAGQQVT